jgi:hypothetical protein
VTSARNHGHALPIRPGAPDRSVDREGRFGEVPPDRRQVEPFHTATAEGVGERPVRLVRLRDDQEARRVPIQPVDDPGTEPAPDAGEVLDVVE